MKNRLIILFIFGMALFSIQAQNKQISGNVRNNAGESLPGVSVKVEGKQQGTITDIEGAYRIMASEGDRLIFSFIGMKSETKTVGKQAVINVVLDEGVIELDEFVAIGYGNQKKSDLTGSVASVTAKDLETKNAMSVDQLLQGQLAGVKVSANSGAPGGAMQILVRGGNSMQGSNEPLYVIDGFPIEINQDEIASDVSAGDAQQYNNILSSINPNDIERIEVLKDASATAIYGSKGANGVVLITTKKGDTEKKGKDIVEVNYTFSIDEIARKIPMLEPWEWAQNYNEFIRVTGSASTRHAFDGTNDANGIYWPTIDDIKNQTNTLYGPWGVNWQDEMFRMAKTHNLNVSLRGNNENMNYAVSGNLLSNEGIIPNTDFDRVVLKGNMTRKLSNKFRMSVNGQISRSVGNQKPTAGNTTANMGVILNSLRYNNVFPAYFIDGSYFNLKGEDADDMSINHPLLFVYEVKNQVKTTSVIGAAGAEYTPVKNLVIKSNLNFRYGLSLRDVYFPKTTQQGATAQGYSGNSWSETSNIVSENFVNYSFKIQKNHEISLMAGFSYEETQMRMLNLRVYSFFSDDLQGMNLSEGTQPQIPANSIITTKMESFYGRLNYAFADKYLLTATFRGDGSSKFGVNNKWAYFPSFAGAWRVKEEPFMKNIKWISNAKVRAGYGLSGSQAISPYQSLSLLTSEGYYFGSTYVKGIGVGHYNWTAAGGNYTGLGEPDLKWETTGQFNAGFDLGLSKNRYNITVDLYNKTTWDLHQSVELPIESGYSYTIRNMGTIQNRGFEISFNGNFRFNQVRWSPSINYSMNRNEVVSLGGQYDYILGPALISGDGGDPFIGHVSMVGHPMGSYFGYKTNGIIQNQEQANELTSSVGILEPGEVRYVDISGPDGVPDGKVDANDKTIIGNPYADFEINFNNKFTYKNFELAINLSGVYGNDILNVNLAEIEAGTSARVESVRMRDIWTVYNPSNTQPKIGPARAKIMSDRYVEDGSYIKLKNLMLAYNFNVKKIKQISKAQIYLKGSNLVTLTKYSGYDPEVNQYQNNQKPGVDYGSYPASRSYAIGMSIGF
jgi:TonB-linked SusC/RagA family outer membrane protein